VSDPTVDSEVAETFDAVIEAMDNAMILVTTRSKLGEQGGCLVGFATQCSINPRRYLVCLSNKNHTCEVALSAEHLAVHVIPPTAMELAHLFGEETGDMIDKFDRCDWSDGPGGLPILAGASAWFVGRIGERIDFGDHIGHVLDLEAAAVAAESGEVGEVLHVQPVMGFDPGHEA
jgi:flavin reductase (DIM6/NTAB) family NADH-FMN oxidoreductase RutF